MRILVIGSGGMLGHVLTIFLKEKDYEVYDVSQKFRCNNDTYFLNVLDEKRFSDYLNSNNFDIVINCAAMLVTASEVRKIEAIKLNSLFPHWLEKFYEKTNTRVIHVSTSGVYYGDNPPYSEEARHDAINFYGKTKSLGELNNEKDLTIRSDFFGPDMKPDGSGLFNWAMKQEGSVCGYSNVLINGVTSLEFSKFIEYVINNPISGVYNLHSRDAISKAELLRKIYKLMSKRVQVIDDLSIKRNTCVTSIRKDCQYISKPYVQQLKELKQWMDGHKELYRHYYY